MISVAYDKKYFPDNDGNKYLEILRAVIKANDNSISEEDVNSILNNLGIPNSESLNKLSKQNGYNNSYIYGDYKYQINVDLAENIRDTIIVDVQDKPLI